MKNSSTNGQYILVRSKQPENKYGAFLQELLKSEGFMGFEIIDIDTAPIPQFTKRDMIIVTRCYLKEAEFASIKEAVSQGASAMLIQPQKRFATRFGWKAENVVFYPGYIKVNDNYPGAGVPLQTHVPVPLYLATENTKAWNIIAKAVDCTWSDTEYAAAAACKFGAGKLAFLFYDLPLVVARIRFGNPDLAGYNTAGLDWPHTCDLFAGYIDKRLKHLPQADFHTQMLAKILTELSPYPLPRFWYYEETEQKTACIFQSDDDYSAPEEFEDLAAAVEKRNGAVSFYLMEHTKLSPEQAKDLVSRGHSIAPHIDASESIKGNDRFDDLYFAFPEQLANETKRFDEKYGCHGATLQSHYAPWGTYMEWVPAHVASGYRLLFAYMSSFPDRGWTDDIEKQAMNWGIFLCGSGRPIRFFDRHGEQFNCWQQPLIFFDDALLIEFFAMKERALRIFSSKLEDSAKRTHSTLSILSHPLSFTGYSKPVWEAVLDILHAGGHPVYNGDKWLDFLDRRSAVEITHATTDTGTLLLKVNKLDGRLPLMVPASDVLEVLVNGQSAESIKHTRLNETYEYIQLDSAKHGSNPEIEIIKSEGAK